VRGEVAGRLRGAGRRQGGHVLRSGTSGRRLAAGRGAEAQAGRHFRAGAAPARLRLDLRAGAAGAGARPRRPALFGRHPHGGAQPGGPGAGAVHRGAAAGGGPPRERQVGDDRARGRAHGQRGG
jgi:hypothetical protein